MLAQVKGETVAFFEFVWIRSLTGAFLLLFFSQSNIHNFRLLWRRPFISSMISSHPFASSHFCPSRSFPIRGWTITNDGQRLVFVCRPGLGVETPFVRLPNDGSADRRPNNEPVCRSSSGSSGGK